MGVQLAICALNEWDPTVSLNLTLPDGWLHLASLPNSGIDVIHRSVANVVTQLGWTNSSLTASHANVAIQ